MSYQMVFVYFTNHLTSIISSNFRLCWIMKTKIIYEKWLACHSERSHYLRKKKKKTHTHTHTKGAKLTPAFLREIKIYFLSEENVLNALD